MLLRPLAGGREWNEAFGPRFEFFLNPVVGHTQRKQVCSVVSGKNSSTNVDPFGSRFRKSFYRSCWGRYSGAFERRETREAPT